MRLKLKKYQFADFELCEPPRARWYRRKNREDKRVDEGKSAKLSYFTREKQREACIKLITHYLLLTPAELEQINYLGKNKHCSKNKTNRLISYSITYFFNLFLIYTLSIQRYWGCLEIFHESKMNSDF